jgi:1-deoxy-D-xylulose-5-phosphate reductoisomerase
MSSANAGSRLRICILGSTGSIGTSTLDVLSRHPERFEVFALTAHHRVDELLAQCIAWRPKFAVLPESGPAQTLQAQLRNAGS